MAGYKGVMNVKIDFLPLRFIPSRDLNPEGTGVGDIGKLPKRIIRRSKNGCLTCRQRRVKCDESPVRCRNCINLSLDCSYPPRPQTLEFPSAPSRGTSNLSPPPSPSSNRRKISHPDSSRGNACSSCRKGKTRCSRERPECERCERSGTACVYVEECDRASVGLRAVYSASQSPEPPAQTQQLLSKPATLPMGEQLDFLLDAFYRWVYPTQANAFLRRADLFSDISEGRISPILLNAICAVSYRYTSFADKNHPDGGTQAAEWCNEAKTELMRDADRFTFAKVAACILLVWHDNNSGRYGSGWLLIALAWRMATAMGFAEKSKDNSSMDWKEEEARRRLLWAIIAADCIGSGGIEDYSVAQCDIAELQLSSPEHVFAMGIPGSMVGTVNQAQFALGFPPRDGDSVLGRFAWLLVVRRGLLRYVAKGETESARPWTTASQFNTFVDRLRIWKTTLPPELVFSSQNLLARKGTPEYGLFLAVHALHDQLHSDLYRIAMPGFPESLRQDLFAEAPRDWLEKARSGFYIRARGITEKLKVSDRLYPTWQPSDPIWKMLAYESVRNQLAYLCQSTAPVVNREEIAAGFELTVEYVGRMTTYLSTMKRLVRELLKLLLRHDYIVRSRHIDAIDMSASGWRTPEQGPTLGRLRYMSRYYKHANADRISRRVTRGEDISELDPLSSEAAATTTGPLSPDRINTQESQQLSSTAQTGAANWTPAFDMPDLGTTGSFSTWMDDTPVFLQNFDHFGGPDMGSLFDFSLYEGGT